MCLKLVSNGIHKINKTLVPLKLNIIDMPQTKKFNSELGILRVHVSAYMHILLSNNVMAFAK